MEMTNKVTAKSEGLTFDEAVTALGNGFKVRLPEWTGYWFKDEENIKSFTRTGDVVDAWTHRADMHNRKDWQIVTEGLGFDFAILALKSGKLVARKGWNGKGMFIFMRPGDTLTKDLVINVVKSLPASLKEYFADDAWRNNHEEEGSKPVAFTPYLCMKAADGTIVNGWLASQTDMLATDWEVVA